MIKILSLLICSIVFVSQARSDIFAPIADQLYPAQSAAVKGYIGNKLDLSYQTVSSPRIMNGLLPLLIIVPRHPAGKVNFGANGLPLQFWHTAIVPNLSSEVFWIRQLRD